MYKTRVLVFLSVLSFSAFSLSASLFDGHYVGSVNLEAPNFYNPMTARCDVEVTVTSTPTKIVIARHAKKCGQQKIQQKNQKFEFDVSGSSLLYNGKQVGEMKSDELNAGYNIQDYYIYKVSLKRNENQTLTYTETLEDVSGLVNSVALTVKGDLSLKR